MKHTKRFAFAAMAAALALAVMSQGDIDAASLSSRVDIKLSGTLTSTVGLTAGAAPFSVVKAQVFGNGVGGNQSNVLYTAQRTVAGGATDSLDLAGGGLVDTFGAAIAPARLRVIYIESVTSNATNLTLFGDANSVPVLNTAATTSTLKPGGVFLVTAPDAAGVVVTAATGDIIKIVNGAGASAVYNIVLVGTTS